MSLWEKKYRETNNSMEYIRKNRLKYLNQTDEFGSDSFLLNTKNRTNQAFIDSDIKFTQNQSKLIQLHSYAHYKPTINSQSPWPANSNVYYHPFGNQFQYGNSLVKGLFKISFSSTLLRYKIFGLQKCLNRVFKIEYILRGGDRIFNYVAI
jgi:Tat protein secretion system quality control protein TatD with DNase activity